MALQSEVSPPLVGDPNKDTQIDGDTKSEDNDSAHSTDEDVDLEEGEILESEEEKEEEKKEEKDFTNISLKEALDKSCLQNIEQLVNQAKNAAIVGSPDRSKRERSRKSKKMGANYMDHDRNEGTPDREDGWFPGSPKYKSKFDDKPIDYRMELAAYRGTPPSSPDRKRSEEKSRKKRSSKKKSSKKSRKKIINRKDIKGQRVLKYKKDACKGRICKFFKEGNCAKGSDCMFSHFSPSSYKKRELCKFYLNGHCNKGKECLFMHNEFPCKFFHTGSECYAKKDCRFSHTPLTDEMKRVLADYLRSCHGDDLRHNRSDEREDHDRDRERERDRDRKRRVSRSPEPQGPPPKRTCLLGSPPRHIREAEETKRWQEEMKLLHQQNHPAFEIQMSPNRDEMSPPHFPKPNFYQDTLLNTPSPNKRQANIEAPNPFHSNDTDDYHQDSPSKVYVYDENDFIEIDVSAVKQEKPEEFHWENVHNMSHPEENHIKPFNENSQQELDFTSDVKFDETTQFSEMESSTDCPPAQSPDSTSQAAITDTKDSDDASNQETKFAQEKQLDENVANQPYEPPAPPIVIPSHLPRKQQELFMRVLQHQRKNASTDAANSPTGNENADPQIKKEPIEEKEENVESVTKDSEWYTSEEEDDDDNIQPISDLLKKIQQAPPKPQPQEVKPSSKVDLLAMFNTIQQKTKEKNQGFTSAQQKHSSFWENILGNVPASKPAPVPISNPVISEPKRRTLLPDPVPLPVIKTEPTTPSEPSASKDPRLKNRDPRKLAREANASINIPKPSMMDRNNDLDSNPSLKDLNSPTIKPVAVVASEQANEGIPYRLRGICAKPPNYTPYLHASQSNPSLLKDPRLRKHLTPMQSDEPVIGNGKDYDIVKPSAPPKDVPPIPELLLKYEKPVAAINIFESSSSTKSTVEKAEDTKPSVPIPLIYDPRVKRRDSSSPPLEKEDTKSYVPIQIPLICDPRMKRRDSRSNSGGSDTPPRLTIVDTNTTPPPQDFKSAPVLENALVDPVVEKKWLPPVLEKSWAPPVLEKNSTISVKKELDSDSDSNHDPPPLEIGGKSSQKKCLSPPLNEEFLTVIKKEIPMDISGDSKPVVPPLIIKKIKPTPKAASHLPRAIADPRMARLHGPRRPQVLASDTNSKRITERKKQAPQPEVSKTTDNNTTLDKPKGSDDFKSETDATTVNTSKEEKLKAVTEGKPKAAKSIPKKRRLSEKSEEKKKTVHRNRKSSMDYASPLNSCDATNNSKSLDYNSYNQRPKRGVNSQSGKDSPIINAAPSPTDTSSIPEFVLSDSSNLECDNSSDVNLKDRFKTIDPTASPFC